MSAWAYLAAAIVLEVAGTTSMKLSHGFTRLLPSLLLFVFYVFAFVGLTVALKRLELSVTYAIWAGVGTILTALIGFTMFDEPITVWKVASIGLIIVGVVGLELG